MKTPLRLTVLSLIVVNPLPLLIPQHSVSSADKKKEPTLLLERMQDSEDTDGLPKFKVELRNAGRDDLVLNVGVMLGNGEKQYPNAITLVITDASGKSREFGLPGPFFVAGRVDPFVLPLPAGAAFSLPVDLAKCFPVSSSELDSKWHGAYLIEARYTGKAVSFPEANLDSKGAALMPYWLGSVKSNQLHFDAAGR